MDPGLANRFRRMTSVFRTDLPYLPALVLGRLRDAFGRPFDVRPADRDFGMDRRGGEQLAVVARSSDDVRAAFARARENGEPVSLLGAGHSMNGQTLAAGGTRLALQFPPEPDVCEQVADSDGTITVSGSTPWQDVYALHRVGRTFPVLTDNGAITVAGTLSVGGIGIRSIAYGRQVDWVERLQLVLPDGRELWCSRDEHDALFRHALAGLGTIGVIRRATLRTSPYEPFLVFFRVHYRNLRELVDHVCAVTEGPKHERLHHYFAAVDSGFNAFFGYDLPTEQDARAFATRLPEQLRGHGLWTQTSVSDFEVFLRTRTMLLHRVIAARWGWSRTPTTVQLWNDCVVPSPEAYHALAEHLTTKLLPSSTREHLLGGNLMVLRHQADTPHLPLSLYGSRPPSNGHHYTLGLYYMIPARHEAAIERTKAELRELQALTHAHGGRMYLYGWQDWSADECGRIYGADWQAHRELKHELDPQGLLSPGSLPLAQMS